MAEHYSQTYVGVDCMERYIVVIEPLAFFRQSEQVCSEAVRQLAASVQRAGRWTSALPVESGTGWVMDGNHRLSVAHTLQLRWLPCVALRYGDPRMDVRRWEDGSAYSLEELRRIDRCSLLPYKSTRHVFSPSLPTIDIPLERLR